MSIIPANVNTQKAYQLAARAEYPFGGPALVVTDRKIFTDLVDVNRRKVAFVKDCTEQCETNNVPVPATWTVEIRELELNG